MACMLVFIMSFSTLLPALAENMTFDSDDFEFSDGVITGYNGTATDVVIPAEIGNEKVIGIGNKAFQNKGLISVEFPNTLETIGQMAFAQNSLTSVSFPDSVKIVGEGSFLRNSISEVNFNQGLEEIEDNAFVNSFVEEVTIPGSVKQIGMRTFSSCKHLKEITIGEGVEYIGKYAFEKGELTSVVIPDSVTDIDDGAFWNNHISKVELGDGLERIGNQAFVNNQIESVEIPNGLKILARHAFESNPGFEEKRGFKLRFKGPVENLDKIELEAFCGAEMVGLNWQETEEVDNGCRKYLGHFKNFTNPDGNQDPGVIDAANASLNKMEVIAYVSEEEIIEDWAPKHFTFEGTTLTGFSELGEEKFATDKDIIIPEKTIEGETVDSIGDRVFNLDSFGEDGIRTLTLPETIKSIGMMAFRNNNIVNLELPDSIEELGVGVFAANGDLETLKLSNNLKIIPNGSFTFSKIKELIIPEGVTEIGGSAFSDNKLLSDLTIPNTVEKIASRAFWGAAVTELTIPGSVKVIESSAFTQGRLHSLTLEEGINVIKGSAFKNNSLTEVTIPKSVTELHKTAFDDNSGVNLTYVALIEALENAREADIEGKTEESIAVLQAAIEAGETVNAKPKAILEEVNEVIEEINNAIEALEPDPGLDPDFEFSNGSITKYIGTATEVVIPETINGEEVVAIGNNAFKGKGLTSVRIPDSVATIGMAAFAQNGLTEIELPEQLINMGNMAFFQNELTSVKINDGLTVISTAAFSQNKLTSAEIPESVTSIALKAFMDNELETVNIPSKIKDIGTSAFENNNLGMVTIPAGILSIGDKAFDGNENIKLVYSALVEAIGRAEQIDTADKPEEKVEILLEAIDEAKALNDEPYAALQEVNSAVEKIQEAIIGLEDEWTRPIIIKSISQTEIDDKIEIIVSVSAKEDINGVLILKPINENGRAYKVVYEPKEFTGGENKIKIELKSSDYLKGIKEIKAYVWDSLENMKPLAESVKETLDIEGQVWASEDFEYDGTTLVGFSETGETRFENDKDLIIPETNKEGEPITAIGAEAFWKDAHTEDKDKIRLLMLPNTLEKIGTRAFAGNLIKSLKIPGSVKSIGEGAFLLNQMEDLVINEGLESIDKFAFRDNELTELTIPSSMKELGGRAFYRNKISKLTILPGIEKLGEQCFENNIIQELNMPETVKYIDLGAFVYNSLENVKLPEGLKILGPKSFGVNNMESIVFPETVEWFCPNAFRKNKGFESGEFKIFIDKIVRIDGDIKESVLKDELSREIKVRAAVFEGLIDETKHKIDIKLWERIGEEDGYLIYRGKFEEISAELIKIIEEAEGCGSGTENIVENMQRTSLIVKVKLTGELLEPEEPEEPGEPGEPDDPILEVWDSEHFTFEGTTLTGFSESGQERFETDKDVVIPDKTIEGETVDSIGDKAFNIDVLFGKDGIRSLILPETIKSIGTMAFRNNNIVNLKLPNSVEELGDGAFAANRDLETLRLSNSLKSIPGGAFSFNKVKKLVIPEGVTEIGGSAFTDNDLLSDLTIPDTVEKIATRAFMNIVVADLTIPGSVKEIESSAFSGGTLSSLVLEEGIEIIKNDVFKRNKLAEVIIPKSVIELHKSAFNLNPNINIKYASLIEILEEAEKVNTEGKTEESVEALQAAIEAGKAINNKLEATLEEVNTVVKEIQEAIDSLQDKPIIIEDINKTKIDNKIEISISVLAKEDI